MKTIVRISNDYNSRNAWHLWKEDIYYLVNDPDGVEVHCEISNGNFINPVDSEKNYETSKDDYKNMIVVSARGYSQGDWQEYRIYHNHDEDYKPLLQLADLLTKTFTHQNDYEVETFKRIEVDGEVYDSNEREYSIFSVIHVEFPTKEEILEEYHAVYEHEYDEVEFNID